jgi:hypothetical protein
MAETPSRPSRPLPPSVTEDVQVRPIFAFAAGLVLLGAVTLLLMGWLLPALTARHAQQALPSTLLAEPVPVPPAPRLQVTPAQELQQGRAAAEAILQSYGWVNKEAGIVRIPITRAMELLVERGLPSRDEQEKRP